LDEQDAKLADFQRRFLGSLPEDGQTNLNILAGLTSQLEAATQALARAQQDKTFAESTLAQQISTWEATRHGNNPQTLEQVMTGLQAQLAALRSKYTDDHPDVIKLRSDIQAMSEKMSSGEAAGTPAASRPGIEPVQIQTLRAQVRQYEQTIKDRTAQQNEIQRRISQYQARVEMSPAVQQEYKQLTRDYQTALEFYNELLKKREQSAMATDLERQQQGEQFQVLDEANLPDRPSYPKKHLFALGGFGGGLLLGLALALFVETRDTSFRNEKDVEAILELPVLAMVPDVNMLVRKGDSSLAG
jgi:uncharacterized protein involved in exopolysaccharide biosynthesis